MSVILLLIFTLTLAHSRSLSLSLALARSLSLTLALARSRSLSLAHSRSLSLTLAHSRSLTLAHSRSLSLSLTLAPIRTHSCTCWCTNICGRMTKAPKSCTLKTRVNLVHKLSNDSSNLSAFRTNRWQVPWRLFYILCTKETVCSQLVTNMKWQVGINMSLQNSQLIQSNTI